MAFALETAEGGYRRKRILESLGVAGAAIRPESYPLSCSALALAGKKGDVSTMEAKTPAKRALAVLDTPAPPAPAPIDPTGRRRLIPSA
jgi:hypothetical protein